jgi:hypothetical protein
MISSALNGIWPAADPAGLATDASAATSLRKSEMKIMAIPLWQAVHWRDERAHHPGARLFGVASQDGRS